MYPKPGHEDVDIATQKADMCIAKVAMFQFFKDFHNNINKSLMRTVVIVRNKPWIEHLESENTVRFLGLSTEWILHKKRNLTTTVYFGV